MWWITVQCKISCMKGYIQIWCSQCELSFFFSLHEVWRLAPLPPALLMHLGVPFYFSSTTELNHLTQTPPNEDQVDVHLLSLIVGVFPPVLPWRTRLNIYQIHGAAERAQCLPHRHQYFLQHWYSGTHSREISCHVSFPPSSHRGYQESYSARSRFAVVRCFSFFQQ